jgi:hypothetical protein
MMLARADPFWDLPRKHFRNIVIDPPQQFRSFTALQTANWDSRRDVEKPPGMGVVGQRDQQVQRHIGGSS